MHRGIADILNDIAETSKKTQWNKVRHIDTTSKTRKQTRSSTQFETDYSLIQLEKDPSYVHDKKMLGLIKD